MTNNINIFSDGDHAIIRKGYDAWYTKHNGRTLADELTDGCEVIVRHCAQYSKPWGEWLVDTTAVDPLVGWCADIPVQFLAKIVAPEATLGRNGDD